MKLRALLLVALLALASVVAASAKAAGPPFNGCGVSKKDGDADASDPVADPAPDETEIEAGWVQYDAAKGADATTINWQIKNLTGSVPPPATSISYTAVYGYTGDTTNFVRAHVDFAGLVAFEYGHTEPVATSTRYAYDGPTRGELFPGEHGVVSVVVPEEAGGKVGTALKGITAQTQLGRTTVVPSAISQSPSRGLSFQNDDVGIGSFTIGPCSDAPSTREPAPPPGGGDAPPTTSDEPLPVKVRSKSIKRAKKRKKVKIKLSSSETITDVGARLAKGRKSYGTGKLRELDGAGTLKIKLRRTIKKGTYVLDLAGTDSSGARRLASFRLKVR